jgi:hypothetical protein
MSGKISHVAATKRLMASAAVTTAALSFLQSAKAVPIPDGPIVSLQFAGGGSNGPDNTYIPPEVPYFALNNSSISAGILGATNWNYAVDAWQYSGPGSSSESWSGNDTGTQQEAILVDSNGNTTAGDSSYSPAGVSYSFAYQYVGPTQGNAFSGSGDNALATEEMGASHGAAATLTLSGLNPTGNYDLIAYVGPIFFETDPEAVSVGSTTYYLTSSSSLSTWSQSTYTTSSAGAPVANYAEFDNLSGPIVTVTLPAIGYYGLDGIEIVPVAGSVPEPASLGLLAVAGLGLLRPSRRRI